MCLLLLELETQAILSLLAILMVTPPGMVMSPGFMLAGQAPSQVPVISISWVPLACAMDEPVVTDVATKAPSSLYPDGGVIAGIRSAVRTIRVEAILIGNGEDRDVSREALRNAGFFFFDLVGNHGPDRHADERGT